MAEKQLTLISGIYKIQSVCKPERVYIGSSINIGRRKTNHFIRLKLNIHPNPILQNHYNKYGKEDLVFSIVELCNINSLLEKEQEFIDKYNPFFNICKIAGSSEGIKRKDIEGENHPNCKISKDEVIEIKKLYNTGKYKPSQISKILNISQIIIEEIVRGRSWKSEDSIKIVRIDARKNRTKESVQKQLESRRIRGGKTASISVKQINPDTKEIICIFDSIKQASDNTGIHKATIRASVEGKTTKCGYIWEKN